jgi:hypothetical protein
VTQQTNPANLQPTRPAPPRPTKAAVKAGRSRKRVLVIAAAALAIPALGFHGCGAGHGPHDDTNNDLSVTPDGSPCDGYCASNSQLPELRTNEWYDEACGGKCGAVPGLPPFTPGGGLAIP